MSFTGQVKNEVASLEIRSPECFSELSSMLRNIGIIQNNVLKISTENEMVAERIFNMFRKIFSIIPKVTVRKGYNFHKNYIYILEINSKLDEIRETLSFENNIPPQYLVEGEEEKKSYLQGLFLACGSINDPKKSRYHLEFYVDIKEYAEFISKILNEFYLNSKVLKRDNKYMVYIKEAEKIGDFLRIIQSINSLFYYEDIRIYRDHVNMTNRLNNCEQANVDKMIQTATNQVKEIQTIENIQGLDLLDEKTKEAAIYRLKYPEASLQELSEIISLETGNSITKSGLHHRFVKIKNLATKIREKENEKNVNKK